jgi:hypothetical protein
MVGNRTAGGRESPGRGEGAGGVEVIREQSQGWEWNRRRELCGKGLCRVEKVEAGGNLGG